MASKIRQSAHIGWAVNRDKVVLPPRCLGLLLGICSYSWEARLLAKHGKGGKGKRSLRARLIINTFLCSSIGIYTATKTIIEGLDNAL